MLKRLKMNNYYFNTIYYWKCNTSYKWQTLFCLCMDIYNNLLIWAYLLIKWLLLLKSKSALISFIEYFMSGHVIAICAFKSNGNINISNEICCISQFFSISKTDEIIKIKNPHFNIGHVCLISHRYGHFISQNVLVSWTLHRSWTLLSHSPRTHNQIGLCLNKMT